MLPPKVPASKAQKDDELEKSTAKDSNPNTLADVITGSGIDLDKEAEALLQSYGSQGLSSTMSPHGSFNQWNQQTNHGAYQGTGPLSQARTQEQQEEELRQKHSTVARILNEAAALPLTDPFLLAAGVRHRMSKKVYEHGIKLDLEGLFDKIPSAVQNVQRREMAGSGGESVVELQATSLLNNGAPLVDLVSLVSLAAEERVRTVIEDAFALAQGRQNTAQGVVVPANLADIAVADGPSRRTDVAVPNISKTSWEATDNTSSPTARLPTPPNDVPPAKQPTIQFHSNPTVEHLKRRMLEDEAFEKARIAKRQKRLQGNTTTGADAAAAAPSPIIERPLTKKERDRVNKGNNTDEAVHARANETAALALGGKKKKYSWMDMGKGGGGSGKSTPRSNANTGGGGSGTATPAVAQQDVALTAKKREFRGGDFEKGEHEGKIQLRDLVHVLELDGKERKALTQIIARMRSAEPDGKTEERPRPAPATPLAR
jgi:hypothetical protein